MCFLHLDQTANKTHKVKEKITMLVMFIKFVYKFVWEDHQTSCHVCSLVFRNNFKRMQKLFKLKMLARKSLGSSNTSKPRVFKVIRLFNFLLKFQNIYFVSLFETSCLSDHHCMVLTGSSLEDMQDLRKCIALLHSDHEKMFAVFVQVLTWQVLHSHVSCLLLDQIS